MYTAAHVILVGYNHLLGIESSRINYRVISALLIYTCKHTQTHTQIYYMIHIDLHVTVLEVFIIIIRLPPDIY